MKDRRAHEETLFRAARARWLVRCRRRIAGAAPATTPVPSPAPTRRECRGAAARMADAIWTKS